MLLFFGHWHLDYNAPVVCQCKSVKDIINSMIFYDRLYYPALLDPSSTSQLLEMARQKNIFSVMAMVTVGASAFILPLKQPLNGPALCVQRASSTTRFAVSQDELKKQVGYKSVDDYVQSGMVVGLGTGSTAAFAGRYIGRL